MDPKGSDHVVGEAADYVHGRLSPERVREIEDHLRWCRDCAADLDLAWRLAWDEDAARSIHPSADRIVAIAEGDAPVKDESKHLAECRECRRDLEWLRDAPSPGEALAMPTAGRQRPALLSGVRRALGVIAGRWKSLPQAGRILLPAGAAALGVYLLIQIREPPSLSDLVTIAPLPARLGRGDVQTGFDEVFQRALESYRNSSYSEAERLFQEAASLDPDHPEVHLYLGSCRLLSGRFVEAEADFRSSLTRAVTPEQRDEALWQLANARLVQDDAEGARFHLLEITGIGGLHQEDARRLLQRMQRLRR